MRGLLWLLLSGPSFALLAGTKKTPPFERRKVINAKKSFSTINEGDTLEWPEDAIKKLSGKNAWGDWRPENGMEGDVIFSWGQTKHLLRFTGVQDKGGMADKYVVMNAAGLAGGITKPSKAQNESKEGDPEMRTIKDVGKLLSTVNRADALVWPDDKKHLRAKAGQDAWGDWRPENGMKGQVLHSWGTKHLLHVDGKYCVMGEDGLEGNPRSMKKKRKGKGKKKKKKKKGKNKKKRTA